MNIVVVREPITRAQALAVAREIYHDMVKGVVDVWGFNVYPEREDETWIEFTSLINVRPQAGNKGMTIEDHVLRDTIRSIVERLII